MPGLFDLTQNTILHNLRLEQLRRTANKTMKLKAREAFYAHRKIMNKFNIPVMGSQDINNGN